MNTREFTKGERAQHHIKELKIAPVRALIIKILVYSAIKIKAKGPAAYSTLNPDTNSDSPSAKSKGERLVSASTVTTQAPNKGGNKTASQTLPTNTKE